MPVSIEFDAASPTAYGNSVLTERTHGAQLIRKLAKQKGIYDKNRTQIEP